MAARLVSAQERLRLPEHVGQSTHATSTAAAQALAEHVGDTVRKALDARGEASLVVSGGRSPVAFMEALASQNLDWAKVSVTLADERWVPAGHPDSNAGLVSKHLLSGQAAKGALVNLYGGEETPEAGVAGCIERLSKMPTPFDVVVLGMGEDGHTASLFPHAAELKGLLDPKAPAAGAVHPDGAPHARMSLSLPRLLDARAIYILISGPRKREVIEAAWREADPLSKPVTTVLMQQRTPVDVVYGAAD